MSLVTVIAPSQCDLIDCPRGQVFIELAFHCIRQEKYEDSLKWIASAVELCPGVVDELDKILQTSTAVSQLSTKLGGLKPEPGETPGPHAAVLASLFYKGHIPSRKKAGDDGKRSGTANGKLTGGRSLEEKKAAIQRAIEASESKFVTPGPGHYDHEPGVGCTRVCLLLCDW